MEIRELRPDTRRRRILKVQIPVEVQLRLHALRIHRGDPISATVEKAIEAYFAKHLPRSALSPFPDSNEGGPAPC
ncbi:MAG: hypothetical protein ACT4PT_07975 [Methanobacteriota archaeon]